MLFSRGRKGEGVNIEADAVLIAGAPYLPPYVPLRKVGLSHDDFAAITTVQNIGRVLRKPESFPLIILADERFRKLQQLTKYFEFKEVESLHSLDELLRGYKKSTQGSVI